MNWTERFKREFLSGWKLFEVIWLAIFIIAQIWIYVQQPDSWLAMISSIAGILCVVLVSKGKISNYFFGLIFAYTYFYVAWGSNFLGEMNTVLYVYLPAQFIGYFMWKNNMQNDDGGESVIAKALSAKGWGMLLIAIAIGSFLYLQALRAAGGSSTELDSLTSTVTIAAQLLMILRYREQWLLWITLNILSIALWEEKQAMYLMYSAYLLNSIYGYYNWTKLAKQVQK
ncbi:nicotinamide riboside transporter PnuC [Rodentibacter myodis]|uniref:Nicotinamide riboside transporter PnuC n=1 Tax=Rodentibacter myodis TaxID=1907939 RepID=A0A1V3JKQ0_9PAST|nr:nicotinamide riboside transporter PnuC [Rodentibacter myodis]OOF57351.1 nicotinamide riboside transporter pnuC [Rodentibacter myodis]